MNDGNWEGAAGLFKESAELTPHFKTYELWGECLMKLNRFSEAIPPLSAATDLNKGVRSASLLAETFFREGDYSLAANTARLALERDSNNKLALSVLDQALAKLGGSI